MLKNIIEFFEVIYCTYRIIREFRKPKAEQDNELINVLLFGSEKKYQEFVKNSKIHLNIKYKVIK